MCTENRVTDLRSRLEHVETVEIRTGACRVATSASGFNFDEFAEGGQMTVATIDILDVEQHHSGDTLQKETVQAVKELVYLNKLAVSGFDHHSVMLDQFTQMCTHVLALELRCVDLRNALAG
jgi:hypothetical protein